MSTHLRTVFVLLICFVSLADTGKPSSSASSLQSSNQMRIRFNVAAFAEHAGHSEPISETTIEGPQGTDFNIKLQGGKFQMEARFLTDLVASDLLKVRADLNTRRLYGYSERNRPLYEEDAQKQNFELNFNEKLVLLPFGRTDNSDVLRIEITSSVSELSAFVGSGKQRPLEITIIKASPGDAISVEASKVPHRFAVEATLLEDGREVARGTTQMLLEAANELILKPTEQASTEVIDHPLALMLSVDRYMRSRPLDHAAIAFDAYELDGLQGTERRPLGLLGMGISEIGSSLAYDLSDYYLKSSGRKYELHFRIKLAPGEDAN